MALEVLSWVLVFVLGCGESRRTRLGRRLHGRYYLAADFGGASLRDFLGISAVGEMAKAQTAVRTVLGSEVNADGLLDDIANGVTLPQQEWEIAQSLAELTRIGRRLSEVTGDRPDSARVREAIEPQQRALRTSAASVAERVEALERYADRVLAADERYGEWQAIREVEALSADTHEVLARTVRDDLAVAEIDGLADRAELHPFQRILAEAREAGLVLTAPAGSEA